MTFLDPAAPPRPPLPSDGYSTQAPARPPPPPTLDTTDDESEDLFQHAPTASQGPIMVKEIICYLVINNMGVTIQPSFKYMVKMESGYEITSTNWPKNYSEKWSRKIYFEIPPCRKLFPISS